MKKYPKISVIMSVYNGMSYLVEAVESILHQTYKNFEFIIVDDASIDGSWEYLKSLKDKRIRLIKNKKNLGLAASLNKALKIARGDYVARMDADDVSLPNRFQQQLKFMLKNPEIGLCGTWATLVDENNTIIKEIRKPTTDQQIKKRIWIPSIIHPTWFVRREVFNDLNGYDVSFDGAEDFEFVLRAKSKYKMANLNENLLLYRTYPSRRSENDIQKMFRMEFKAKLYHFTTGNLGFSFLPLLIYKFFTTYLIPPSVKLWIARRLKRA